MSGTHLIDTGDPPGVGDSGSVPLLFLHGLGGSAEYWEPQLQALAQRVRCVAWTMPGYGPSAALTEPTISSLADAAIEALDELGIGQADLIGHSMGGYVAQQMACLRPERVRRLVLAATTAAFGKPGSSFNEQFLAARLEPLNAGATPAGLAPDIVAGLVADTASAEVREQAALSMSAITADAYRDALRALVGWDGRDSVPNLTHKTLCLAADQDTTVPPRAMERLADLMPNASLHVIADSGHLLNLEQPEIFTNHLVRFLELD